MTDPPGRARPSPGRARPSPGRSKRPGESAASGRPGESAALRPPSPPPTPSPTPGASPPIGSPHQLDAVEIAGIAVCCVSAALSAIVSVLLTPLYWGADLVPVSVLLAAASNVALPMIARRLGASTLVAALPYGIWLIAVIVLGISRPEGDVLLPAGSGAQPWVTYGMLLAGGLAGGATLVAQSMATQSMATQSMATQPRGPLEAPGPRPE